MVEKAGKDWKRKMFEPAQHFYGWCFQLILIDAPFLMVNLLQFALDFNSLPILEGFLKWWYPISSFTLFADFPS